MHKFHLFIREEYSGPQGFGGYYGSYPSEEKMLERVSEDVSEMASDYYDFVEVKPDGSLFRYKTVAGERVKSAMLKVGKFDGKALMSEVIPEKEDD